MELKIKQIGLALGFLITGIFITNLTLFLIKSTSRSLPLKIVTVDLSSIINQEVARLQKGQFTSEQIEVKSKQFVAELSHSLSTYAKQKRVMIMPREAIVAGAKDVTAEFTGQDVADAH